MSLSIKYTEKDLSCLLPATASEKYLQAVTNYKYGWFMSEDFILPFIIEKKSWFKRLVFTHETIYIQPKDLEKEQVFLTEVIKLARSTEADFIYQPKPGVVFFTYPLESIHAPFGSYIIDLSFSEETLFDNLHTKHRNVIRKAQKDGVVIKEGKEYLEDCFELVKETMSRQNKPYISRVEIEKLSELMGEELKFYVAIKEEILQGCAIILYRKGFSAYYLKGGSISKPYTGSLNLLQWTAILDMKRLGVNIYDFVGARLSPQEGSKLETIQRFKARFGSQMKVGYLWKYPLNKFKYNAFYFLARIHARLKKQTYIGDIIDEENAIEKSEVNFNL